MNTEVMNIIIDAILFGIVGGALYWAVRELRQAKKDIFSLQVKVAEMETETGNKYLDILKKMESNDDLMERILTHAQSVLDDTAKIMENNENIIKEDKKLVEWVKEREEAYTELRESCSKLLEVSAMEKEVSA